MLGRLVDFDECAGPVATMLWHDCRLCNVINPMLHTPEPSSDNRLPAACCLRVIIKGLLAFRATGKPKLIIPQL